MADTYNSSVSTSNGISSLTYSGSLDFTGNLEDNHYTQWFLIGDANNSNAGYFSKASGGGGTNGDINVTLQVSNDKSNWVDVSTLVADHDATANQDALLGDTNYEAFKAYKYARLKADGLTSNDYTTLDWSINLTKDEAVASKDNGSVLGADSGDTDD